MNALSLPGTMTSAEFALMAGKLALQLRAEIDPASIASYYEVLRGLSQDAVRAAQEGFSREKGRKWYPSAPEWLEAAQAANAAFLRASTSPAREEPWRDECGACCDTGWEEFQCAGDRTCGRRVTHAAHRFVRACTCRPVNATYRRHQQFGAGA